MDMLDRSLSGPLTLISAAAGFGKTTLVSEWTDRLSAGNPPAMPVAWVSLDESDSDLELFLLYFVTAIRTVFPTACAETLVLLQSLRVLDPKPLLISLSNELEQLPARMVLVLDDYHAIRGEAVHDFLSELIRHWPQPLHLVVISRSNPPLSLAQLRATGRVTVISTRELRFTPEETAAFFDKVLAVPLSPVAVAALDQHIEGWIAGLRLVSLSLRTATDVETEVISLTGTSAEITDYMVDQVVSQQPPAILTFLMVTSILDRFCAPLCERLIKVVGAAERGITDCDIDASIRWLERANLFMVPLDNHREWFRYHHLFRDLLQRRLLAEVGPVQVTELHRTAAAWLAEHGLIDAALHHALAIGDLDLTAALMAGELCAVLNREDRSTMERWLRLLPDDFVNRQPWLLVMRAFALQFSWQLPSAAKLAGRIETLLDEGGAAMATMGDLAVLHGLIAVLRGQETFTLTCNAARAIEYCELALTLMPEAWRYTRGGAYVYLGLGMRARGHGDAAQRILIDEYESVKSKTDAYALRILFTVCLIAIEDGHLEQAKQVGDVILKHVAPGQLMVVQGWTHYSLGVVTYAWNDLDAAARHFQALVDNRYAVHTQSARNGMVGLARVHLAKGETAAAWHIAELYSQLDLDRLGQIGDEVRSLRAEIEYWRGEKEKAFRWADSYTAQPPARLMTYLQDPHMAKARILLARGAETDVQAALEILDELYEIATSIFSIRFQIEILALRAVTLERQGRVAAALAALQEAVSLAQHGGFVRVFVDLGPRMQAMLLRLAQQGRAGQMIRSILAAFPAPQQKSINGAGASETRTANAGLIEPLTTRELEVLALLSLRLSDREIADRLVISTTTVKRHTANLYGKLGVTGRRDAVVKAEALGLLAGRQGQPSQSFD